MNQALSTLRRRFPRLASAVKPLRPTTWRTRWSFRGMTTQEVFTKIHDDALWDSRESRSGAGSTLQATESIREALSRVLRSYNIETMLDAPCGDYYWMRHLDYPLRRYVGGEIVESLVERLNEQYGNEHRSFRVLDITTDPLPQSDMFFCRDCMIHLTNWQVLAVLANFTASGCGYLCASTYPTTTMNLEGQTGGSRPVNLELPPFNLPTPLATLADPAVHSDHRVMGVWGRDQLG